MTGLIEFGTVKEFSMFGKRGVLPAVWIGGKIAADTEEGATTELELALFEFPAELVELSLGGSSIVLSSCRSTGALGNAGRNADNGVVVSVRGCAPCGTRLGMILGGSA
jgi:hypothetical protein